MPIGTSTFGLVGMKFSFALIPGLSNHVSQREAVVASTPRVVPGWSCSEQLPREVGGGGRHQKKASIRFILSPLSLTRQALTWPSLFVSCCLDTRIKD